MGDDGIDFSCHRPRFGVGGNGQVPWSTTDGSGVKAH